MEDGHSNGNVCIRMKTTERLTMKCEVCVASYPASYPIYSPPWDNLIHLTHEYLFFYPYLVLIFLPL